MAEGMEKGHKGFEKGHAPLAGCGRPLGSRTAINLVRDYFRNATVELFPDFLEALRSIKESDPKGFAENYLKMSERVIPKLAMLRMEDEREGATAATHLSDLSAWNMSVTNKEKVQIDDEED